MSSFVSGDLLESIVELASTMSLPSMDLGTEGGLASLYALVDIPPSIFLSLFVCIAIVRFLHLFSTPEQPRITIAEAGSDALKSVLGDMPILKEVYRPPTFWGRSGHLQTAAYGLLGHASLRRTANRRVLVRLADGASLTYDVFEPLAEHPSGQEITLCLTPGIANSAESNYIRTCVHYAQEAGYRCCVLNHLGALVGVPLTSPRIFSYGGTAELHAMVSNVVSTYPSTRLIAIGFSMGANITTKFLLESSQEIRNRVIIGLSVGQGYSATVSAPMYCDWENGRRAYNYVITENMKRLLRRNYDVAVAPHVQSGLINEQRLWATTSIVGVDEQYNRRVGGFQTVDDFYAWCSCLPHLEKISVPMIFFNAMDDPIVPRSLWEPVKELAGRKGEVAFISTKHGGHLGFLEGHSLAPLSVTWLDRFIVQMCNSAVAVYDGTKK